MELLPTPIPALKVVKLRVNGDSRGFFVERFHEDKFKSLGLPTHFSQDNHSRSAPGVLRGLHYQVNPVQGKLVGVTRGKVWDVAVDLRPDSATYGQHYGVELSDENGLLFWIPPGFGHGFCVLGDKHADMLYKCTGVYNAAGEGGVRWNDPDLNIPWPIQNPQTSDRDTAMRSFAEFKKDPASWPKGT